MPAYQEHEITLASFAQIDDEIGPHSFSPAEYAVVRRVIHTTADFEFKRLLQFSQQPIAAATKALQQRTPILVDVSMVAAGIGSVVSRTWKSEVITAVRQVPQQQPTPNQLTSDQQSQRAKNTASKIALAKQTRSAAGMQVSIRNFPGAIVAVGNAPTALLAICHAIESGQPPPAVVIGAPVGFINVVESKQALSALAVPHILVEGRKGGSAVAAAILNALMILAWEQA